MLVGAGVLSSVAADGAMAASRHHHRHAVVKHSMQAAPARAETTGLATNGNNPAKRYGTRQLGEEAIKTPTLSTSGNNGVKRYPVRHAAEGAMKEPTLMTTGNNPTKRYKATTSR